MKTMIIPLALMSLVGVGCDSLPQTGYPVVTPEIVTPEKRPMEARNGSGWRISNAPNPDQARVEELEKRVKTLEEWAVKRGGKFK